MLSHLSGATATSGTTTCCSVATTVLIADFGFMGRRPRIDDLALTLYFTLWDLLAGNHADPLATLVALVAAYDAGTTRPLSDAERQALPLAIARQPLWSVGVWAAELDDGHAVAAHLTGHDVALQLGRNILDSIDRWNEALRL
jgi:Ser/Thr protein kinase RdoA (MazF antagonist)